MHAPEILPALESIMQIASEMELDPLLSDAGRRQLYLDTDLHSMNAWVLQPDEFPIATDEAAQEHVIDRIDEGCPGVESRRDVERDVMVHKLTKISEACWYRRHARVSRILRRRIGITAGVSHHVKDSAEKCLRRDIKWQLRCRTGGR